MNKQQANSGVSIGLSSSVFFLGIHIIVDWVNSGASSGDSSLWLLQIGTYFVASLVAANAQYKSQIDNNEPLKDVANAGRGAAMVLCFMAWVYVILRSLTLNDPGMYSGKGIFSFCGFILLDFFVAVAVGSWGGHIVEKQHEHVTTY